MKCLIILTIQVLRLKNALVAFNGIMGPVSQKSPKLFKSISLPQFPLYHPNAKVLGHQTSILNSLGFSYIKNMLKDQLFKTSGLQFDISGLWRNRPQT